MTGFPDKLFKIGFGLTGIVIVTYRIVYKKFRIVDFNYLINECLKYVLILGDTSICNFHIVIVIDL